MKKVQVAAAAAAVLMIVVFAGGAFALTPLVPSPKIDVTATVQAKCVWSADGALTIAIDPTAVGAQAMTATQPQVQCTNKRVLQVSAASTNSGNNDSTGSLVGSLTQGGYTAIPYTFTYDTAPSGNGFGGAAAVNFNIAASVAQSDAAVAEYSTTNYTDTVTLTVMY